MKGPIIAVQEPVLQDVILNFLKKFVRKNFFVLLVQAPDGEDHISSGLLNKGFVPNFIKWIIKSSNVKVNLELPEEHLFKQMKRQKRQNIKNAKNAGIIIRQGSRDDLETFFELMNITCKRRGVSPNPSNLKTLEKIWDIFNQKNKIALFLAELGDKKISALITIMMEKHISLWKFGWSGEYSRFRPNDFLFWEILRWAKAKGFRSADLGAFGTYDIKKGLIIEARENYSEGNDVRFKTGFEGNIFKLQPGLIYFSNLIISLLVRKILLPFADHFTWSEKLIYKLIEII